MTATLPARVDPSVAVYVRVDVRGPGFVKPVFVRTLVEIQRPQPVLKSAVAAQSAVRPEDVEWVLAPVQVNGGAVISTGALTNLVAKRDLHAGEVLTENLLYAPLLVHRGDSVTVKASTGGVTISATMRARASAHYGETIVVEHISSSGTTSARVIGPGLLEALQGTK